mmetsp:Transcript_57027/g.184693  ORF Transcript_57027/g.184693 Transcript_57027/m.184693 type:complete len:287 (+) Transcript_57027:104-964(+)
MVTTAIVKGNHKAGEIQGQNREYSRLFNLLGAKHITIGVNRMDCDTAVYMQMRYDESANVMKSMLIMVGWKQDTVEKDTRVLPISGCLGDNLPEKSKKMGWCKNTVVECSIENFHCGTVYDMLDKLFLVPERPVRALTRMLFADIYLMKGFGDVLAGSVERVQLKLGDEVVFLPTDTVSYMQMRHDGFTNETKSMLIKGDLFANSNDNGGLNIKGLDKQKMPRSDDATVHKKGTTLDLTHEFDVQIHVLNIPIEIKFDYSPIGFVHFSRSACRISVFERKMEDPAR